MVHMVKPYYEVKYHTVLGYHGTVHEYIYALVLVQCTGGCEK